MNVKEKVFPYLKKVAKPGRYTGGEFGEIIKDKENIKARFAFLFPDSYEIGMSNLGMKILYNCLNSHDDIWCERVFAPWIDMSEIMKQHNIPLYALESGDEIKDFDFLGITLQYEMCYSNVLYCLDLANIPFLAKDRDDSFPIIVGGGPCTYNAEPVADFFDVFSIGEGEDALCEMTHLYIQMKQDGSYSKKEFLKRLAGLPGFYVPSLYEISYNNDGTIASINPLENAPEKVLKRCISDFDTALYPEKVPVSFIETVHDRIMLESARGCMRGCRFCQAGIIYRPYREKSYDLLNDQARCIYNNTGYEEISLTSLSISDYTHLRELVDSLKSWTDERKIGLSLPSMRIDSFEAEIMEKVQGVRKTGLTFAPEAGTQRLRNIINKNLTEEEILDGCISAFKKGRTSVKLYFMLGLPYETDEDVCGIAELAQKIVDAYYSIKERQKGKSVDVTISCACFVPKPHTPFQWNGQNSLEELKRKQQLLKSCITSRKIKYNYHESTVSRLEAVFAKGDRRLSEVLIKAFENGIRFDGWDECFSYDSWLNTFEQCGINPDFYALREISQDEILPWSMIDCGVKESFLKNEAALAKAETTTPDCKTKCSHCGAARFGAALCKRCDGKE